ncbi:hypothetical protein [uncultured Nostoc sp.]|uniref:hypothetical protein n=1 Tax=uncultured Nostoc sp. TaxID=340711 RepID=UPI0035CA4ED1
MHKAYSYLAENSCKKLGYAIAIFYQIPTTARRKSKVKSQKSKVKIIVFQALAPFEMVCLFTPSCTTYIFAMVISVTTIGESHIVDITQATKTQ